MKVKIKINKELQKLRVFAFITKDFALNKNFFSCIEGCTCSESYSVESIRENLEKNKLQKDIYTTIKGGKLPPLMVVYKTSNNMALEKIYNKWLSIQPLSEADQNKLSMRFTVEYNYKCVIAAEPSLMYNRIARWYKLSLLRK